MSEEDKTIENTSLQEQFKDIPMRELIGDPLTAAAKEQIETAQNSLDFIERISEEQYQAERSFAGANGEISDYMKVDVPILSVVPIPPMDGNPTFEMEVDADEERTDESVSHKMFVVNASISGCIVSSQSKGKETEAKYRMDDSASQLPQEGLSKLMDVMDSAMEQEMKAANQEQTDETVENCNLVR